MTQNVNEIVKELRLIAGAQNDAGQWPYGEQTLYNAIKLIESQQREIERLKKHPIMIYDEETQSIKPLFTEQEQIQAYRDAFMVIHQNLAHGGHKPEVLKILYEYTDLLRGGHIDAANEVLKKYPGK